MRRGGAGALRTLTLAQEEAVHEEAATIITASAQSATVTSQNPLGFFDECAEVRDSPDSPCSRRPTGTTVS